MKDFFTTHEAAKICNVSQGSIIRWIHDGKIPAAVTPGGHHRIEAKNLTRFLHQLRMPVPSALAKERKRFLLAADNSSLRTLLRDWIRSVCPEAIFEEARESFEAGWKAAQFSPDFAVIDMMQENTSRLNILRCFQERTSYENIRVLFLLPSLSRDHGFFPSHPGIAWVLKPLEKGRFLEKIGEFLKPVAELKKAES